MNSTRNGFKNRKANDRTEPTLHTSLNLADFQESQGYFDNALIGFALKNNRLHEL